MSGLCFVPAEAGTQAPGYVDQTLTLDGEPGTVRAPKGYLPELAGSMDAPRMLTFSATDRYARRLLKYRQKDYIRAHSPREKNHARNEHQTR